MCLITIKPRGIELPTRESLFSSFTNNPHGSGFVVSKNGRQHLHKGFFKFDEYYDAILDEVNIEDNCIMHSRIATSGLVDEENCHPFLLTKNPSRMKLVTVDTDTPCMAHNGILFGYGNKKISDTYEFIMEIMSDNVIKDNLKNHAIQSLLEEAVSTSRLAIMIRGEIILIGHFFNKKGILYSNMSYKETSYYSYKSSSYGIYGHKKYSKYDAKHQFYPDGTEGESEFSYDDEEEETPLWDNDLKRYVGKCEMCGTMSDELSLTDAGWLCPLCYDYLLGDDLQSRVEKEKDKVK
ncbi:MAG: hypothetical protein JRC60_06335 [Deltaproteobacteria bacterium]|nr:hypothetical protein [Deltaproteobacteria bacterium]